MTVKATAHTEPRGTLWSIGCQPSAAESCSPTATCVAVANKAMVATLAIENAGRAAGTAWAAASDACARRPRLRLNLF